MRKIKVEDFTLEDLVTEAFSIPNGWKEEIYVEDGYVEFTSPMTPNTYTAKADNPHEMLDSYRGDLESMSIGDFESFTETKDSKGRSIIKIEGKRVSRKDAIEAVANIVNDWTNPLLELYNIITVGKGHFENSYTWKLDEVEEAW